MSLPLSESDPQIAQAIANEANRQHEGLELIASENFVSLAVLEAALSYSQDRSWKLLQQTNVHLRINLQRVEIAAVHADYFCAHRHRARQFDFAMHFAQHVQSEFSRAGIQCGQLAVGQCGNDEQYCVGSAQSCFEYLVFVHDEIFAQARQVRGRRSFEQMR